MSGEITNTLDSDSLNQIFKLVNIDTLIVVSQNSSKTTESIFDYKYIIPIVIFLCTPLIQYLNRKLREKRERKSKLTYFATLVKSIIVYSEAQLKLMRSYEDSLMNINSVPLLNFIPKNDIEKVVDTIDDEALFYAFTSKYNPPQSILDYKSITSCIETQNSHLDQVVRMTENYLPNYNERRKKFKESVERVTGFLMKNVQDGSFKKHSSFYTVVTNRANKYIEVIDIRTIENAYNGLINPLLKEVSTLEFFKIDIAFELANYLKDSEALYQEIISQRDKFKEGIEELFNRYTMTNERLKKESEQLLRDYFNDSSLSRTNK